MSKYEEMSDKEINIAVTAKAFGCQGWELSEGGCQLFNCGIDGSGYFAQEVVDYCNSWADMGPLINDANIDITFLKAEKGMILASKGDFYTRSRNPLRAAAIVYLMIKDAE